MKSFAEIYTDMIIKNREDYRKENPKLDNKYRASSSGMCSRKIYFESIEKAEPTNPADEKAVRLMRLGEIVHKDFQDMLVKAIKK